MNANVSERTEFTRSPSPCGPHLLLMSATRAPWHGTARHCCLPPPQQSLRQPTSNSRCTRWAGLVLAAAPQGRRNVYHHRYKYTSVYRPFQIYSSSPRKRLRKATVAPQWAGGGSSSRPVGETYGSRLQRPRGRCSCTRRRARARARPRRARTHERRQRQHEGGPVDSET